MTMEHTSRAARYVTLRDYLRVLRHYRLAILAITLIGAGLGLVDAKRQTPVYQASATVQFRDPTQDLSVVGFGSNAVEPPAQQAATQAETLSRAQIVNTIKATIGTKLSTAQLGGSLSASVSPSSSLLIVSGTSTNPGFASRLANTAAQVLVNLDNQHNRTRFKAFADDLRARIKALRAAPGGGTLGQPGVPLTTGTSQLAFYSEELARADTLSQFAEGASVAQQATPPTTPISPKTVRSTILGFVLGLLVAVFFAFLRDSMDRRLRGPHEIESQFHLPVLGYVRNQAMGQIARAGGPNGDGTLDLEAFRIIRRNLEFLDLDSSPRSIVVTSALPEEGKSTVAGSLAFAIASAGKLTLLVDCDLRRPTLSARLGVEQSPGLSDFLARDATPDEILRTIEFHDPLNASLNGSATSLNGHGPTAETAADEHPEATEHSLVFIPSGSPTSRAAELLGSKRFKEFLEQISAVYDVVVLDSSPLLPVADTLEVVPLVEGVIICAREYQTTRDVAAATKSALSRFPDRPTGLVVTGVKPHRGDDDAYTYTYSYST